MPTPHENGAYALLEARHVDALTAAVHAQTTNQAIANELLREQIRQAKILSAAVDRLTSELRLARGAEAIPEPTEAEVSVPRTKSR